SVGYTECFLNQRNTRPGRNPFLSLQNKRHFRPPILCPYCILPLSFSLCLIWPGCILARAWVRSCPRNRKCGFQLLRGCQGSELHLRNAPSFEESSCRDFQFSECLPWSH